MKKGLVPKYSAGRRCSRLTSLYLSWIDVDGTRRDERHSGVDGGRLGDMILAPAAGTIVAAWEGDWGWGAEGALLIRHGREDLGLPDGPAHYYSEFDHLRYEEIRDLAAGTRVERGQKLARVFRPGGKPEYPPEVHWEVWTVADDAATQWDTNEFGSRDWINETARLVDPLSLFQPGAQRRDDGRVEIVPFDRRRDASAYHGFTYILPCPRKQEPRKRRN